MLSFDTNLAVYAAHSGSPHHPKAKEFIYSLSQRKDVAICELVLVELYLKLRNEKIFPQPLSAEEAVAVCQAYRNNRCWRIIENAPVMKEVWPPAAESHFAFRRIIDLRLALTLRYHGVTEFATANTKDFQGMGFTKVWNPLAA
jgi:uncharacterized protein